MDPSVIAILTIDPTQYRIFKNGKATDLTNDDLLIIDQILKKCINNYNSKKERQFHESSIKIQEYMVNKEYYDIDLTSYKRQYVAAINSKGEKEVWVNCFYFDLGDYWKSEVVFICDGGDSCFNLKINLTRRRYYSFSVNGNA